MCNHAPIGEPLGTFWGSVSCPRILQESNYQHPEWRTTARPHELQKNDHRLIIWHLVAPCWFTFAIRELTLPVCTDITEAGASYTMKSMERNNKIRQNPDLSCTKQQSQCYVG